MVQEDREYTPTINWRQISIFLGVTFGLTFLLDLALYVTAGYGQNVGTGLLLQVQMLIPASVAIALQLLVFRNSRIYHLQERPRWFFYFYLAYALIYAIIAVSVVLVSNTLFQTIATVFVQALTLGGLLFLVVLRLVSGKETFERAGLSGGKVRYYVLFGLLLVVVYSAMTGLNALFGLGQAVDVQEFLRQAAGGQATGLEEFPGWAILLMTGLQAVLLAPFMALLIAFGEEYGWRGYLQGELTKMGKVRGVLLVGVIWGLWHAPVILMGHNYPGYPLLGVVLMTLYTIAFAFVFGFAVLKSGSVWLAAFLHGLNNQVLAFLVLMVYKPDDAVFSFGIGLYGLVIWALVVAAILFLGRREWRSPVDGPTPVGTVQERPVAELPPT
jgi:membrane protease YdiL (CAAX protease family)